MNKTMDKFLEMVAADLCRQPNVDLAHTVVVFPGKRAMLYFNEYLLAQSTDPDATLWAPTYMSISDLFASMSGKRLGDPVKLVCLLHQVFNATAKPEKPEPLDSFYFWGEMLLSDFNDVDKSMADAKTLFRNLEDLKQMDDLSYIDKTQREAIEHFFGLFKKEGGSTELQKNFSRVWNSLFAVYEAYRELLTVEGIAYEGMLYRDAVEKLDVDHLPFDRYVFVGFNVLTPVEKKLFTILQNEGKALFYWDYDLSYIEQKNHNAAKFLSENIDNFPSPLGKELFSAFSQPKEIRFVEASTENAQARYLTEWLPENITTPQRDTAIVLCNEELLSPVLHSLPTVYKDKDADKDVPIDYNITMGYPLVQTPAYSFVCAILEAHAQGYNPERTAFRLSQIRNLLNHPFTLRLEREAVRRYNELTGNNVFYPTPEVLKANVKYKKDDDDGVPMDDRFKQLFTPATDKRALCQLLAWALQEVGKTYRGLTDEQQAEEPLLIAYKEAIYEAYTKVNRFLSLIDDGTLADLQTSTLCSLLQRVLSSVRIPFHGEPAEGVQIMGAIETRNLDFRHLVMLSVNEGFMPRVANDVSFIPYVVRKAFGLTTIEHKISVYAYYFYRLLQRAETVTLVYNAVTDDKHKGEMSRFMLQLLVSYPHHITRLQLSAHQKPQGKRTTEVQKTPDVMEALRHRFDISENKDNLLSPSALNNYIDCPLQFYFKYVAGLSSDDEVDEDIDSAMFGTIFHQTAEHIYKGLVGDKGGLVERQMLEPFLAPGEQKIRDHVDEVFRECFFKAGSKANYNGLQLIKRDIIVKFVRMILELDRDMTPFTFVKAEQEVRENFTVEAAGQASFNINLGGRIDRQDSKDSSKLRIVDYKTGGKAKNFKNVADLFLQQKNRAKYIFQIFLYSTIMKEKNPGKQILPQVLYIHHALAPDYKECIQQEESYRKYKDFTEFTDKEANEFRDELTKLLNEQIFNPAVPFKQTEVKDNCKYCDFKALCHKEEEEEWK